MERLPAVDAVHQVRELEKIPWCDGDVSCSRSDEDHPIQSEKRNGQQRQEKRGACRRRQGWR